MYYGLGGFNLFKSLKKLTPKIKIKKGAGLKVLSKVPVVGKFVKKFAGQREAVEVPPDTPGAYLVEAPAPTPAGGLPTWVIPAALGVGGLFLAITILKRRGS